MAIFIWVSTRLQSKNKEHLSIWAWLLARGLTEEVVFFIFSTGTVNLIQRGAIFLARFCYAEEY